MNIAHFFGKKTRQFRVLSGLTQEQLAEICGLHRTYIGAIERGERNITLKNAELIAISLNKSLVEFFSGLDNEY